MTNPNGTRFETRLVHYLVERGFVNAERRTRSGSKDRGDVSGVHQVCIEAKNFKKINLAGWIDEAMVEKENAGARLGVVIFPRRNHHIGKAYVLTTLDQWIDELKGRDQ